MLARQQEIAKLQNTFTNNIAKKIIKKSPPL